MKGVDSVYAPRRPADAAARLGSTASAADIFFTDDKVKVALVHLLGSLVHENLHAEATA